MVFYFIPKRLGYPKFGKYLGGAFLTIFIGLVLHTAFEDQLFTKTDAKHLVEEQEIYLKGDFELIANESMSAIGDYYHTFTLEISEKDKNQAISDIKASPNFKPISKSSVDLYFDSHDRYNGPKQVQNYETTSAFIREYLQPNGKGYAPTYRRIIIDKQMNRLTFEDIDK